MVNDACPFSKSLSPLLISSACAYHKLIFQSQSPDHPKSSSPLALDKKLWPAELLLQCLSYCREMEALSSGRSLDHQAPNLDNVEKVDDDDNQG